MITFTSTRFSPLVIRLLRFDFNDMISNGVSLIMHHHSVSSGTVKIRHPSGEQRHLSSCIFFPLSRILHPGYIRTYMRWQCRHQCMVIIFPLVVHSLSSLTILLTDSSGNALLAVISFLIHLSGPQEIIPKILCGRHAICVNIFFLQYISNGLKDDPKIP